MEIQDITNALGSFNKTELVGIKAQIDFLLGAEAKLNLYDFQDGQLFYEELQIACKRLGRKGDYKTYIESQRAYVANFEAALNSLDWLAGHLTKKTRVNKTALVRWSINLCVAYMAGKGIPITMFHLVLICSRLEAVIESQFPSYIENGLLPVLLKKAING